MSWSIRHALTRSAWSIVLVGVQVLLAGIAAAEEKCPLELHVHVTTELVCPLDSVEVTVEFRNRSDKDLVVAVPTVATTKLTTLRFGTDQGPRFGLACDGPPLQWLGESRTIPPGGSTTSPALFSGGDRCSSRWDEGKWRVWFEYAVTDPTDGSSPYPAALGVMSPYVEFEVAWCDPSVPDWLKRIAAGRYELELEHLDDGYQKLRECEERGPSCVKRAAFLTELQDRETRGEADRCLEILGELWKSSTRDMDKECVLERLDGFTQRWGWRGEIGEWIGSYKSAFYGDSIERWKDRRPPAKANGGK